MGEEIRRISSLRPPVSHSIARAICTSWTVETVESKGSILISIDHCSASLSVLVVNFGIKIRRKLVRLYGQE
jgi:hypothetical protein